MRRTPLLHKLLCVCAASLTLGLFAPTMASQEATNAPAQPALQVVEGQETHGFAPPALRPA